MGVKVYSVALNPKLVEAIDRAAKVLGFENRSSFVSFILRKFIMEEVVDYGKKKLRTGKS